MIKRFFMIQILIQKIFQKSVQCRIKIQITTDKYILKERQVRVCLFNYDDDDEFWEV